MAKNKTKHKEETFLHIRNIRILMLSTVVVALVYYMYLVHTKLIFQRMALRGLIVCVISSLFTYKGKRWAYVCYYIFSSYTIFVGGLGIVAFIAKAFGRLLSVDNRASVAYILRGAFQSVAVYLLHKWKRAQDTI